MGLTVKELKALIDQLPEDAVVVVPAFSSAYRLLARAVTQSLFKTPHDKERLYGEEPADGTKVDAVILS